MRIQWLGALALTIGLLHAGSASATPVWYADVQTSNLLGNRHGDITSLASPGSIGSLIASTNLQSLGTGLGSAHVRTGSPLTITHEFLPNGYAVDAVHHASVMVSVIDDFDRQSEYGQILIGANVLDGGNAFFNLFRGEVTGLISSAGDAITLTVQATRGDFRVMFSALTVHFEGSVPGTPTPAIPEPSAALVFAAGLWIAGRRRRA